MSNHSWGMGTFVTGVDNASEIETYMNDNSLSVSQTYAKLRHNNTGQLLWLNGNLITALEKLSRHWCNSLCIR